MVKSLLIQIVIIAAFFDVSANCMDLSKTARKDKNIPMQIDGEDDRGQKRPRENAGEPERPEKRSRLKDYASRFEIFYKADFVADINKYKLMEPLEQKNYRNIFFSKIYKGLLPIPGESTELKKIIKSIDFDDIDDLDLFGFCLHYWSRSYDLYAPVDKDDLIVINQFRLIEILNEKLKNSQDHFGIYYLCMALLYSNGRGKIFDDYIRKSIELGNGFAQFIDIKTKFKTALFFDLLSQGELDCFDSALKKAAELGCIAAYRFRVLLYLKRGNFKEACSLIKFGSESSGCLDLLKDPGFAILHNAAHNLELCPEAMKDMALILMNEDKIGRLHGVAKKILNRNGKSELLKSNQYINSNIPEAISLLKKAAIGGSAEANYILAILYGENIFWHGLYINIGEIYNAEELASIKLKLHKTAADKGYPESCVVFIKHLISNGEFAEALKYYKFIKNIDESSSFYLENKILLKNLALHEKAILNDPNAQYTLGCYYYNNNQTGLAIKLLSQAFSAGNFPAAACMLGIIYFMNEEYEDIMLARKYLNEALSNSIFNALTQLAKIAIIEGDFSEAFKLLGQAAKANDGEALKLLSDPGYKKLYEIYYDQVQLVTFLRLLRSLPHREAILGADSWLLQFMQNDTQHLLKVAQKLLNNPILSNNIASHELANLYMLLSELNIDPELRKYYIQMAAQLDSPAAYERLANDQLGNTAGVPRNAKKAFSYFKKAADLGSLNAIILMLNSYGYGNVEYEIEIDRFEALKYMTKFVNFYGENLSPENRQPMQNFYNYIFILIREHMVSMPLCLSPEQEANLESFSTHTENPGDVMKNLQNLIDSYMCFSALFSSSYYNKQSFGECGYVKEKFEQILAALNNIKNGFATFYDNIHKPGSFVTFLKPGTPEIQKILEENSDYFPVNKTSYLFRGDELVASLIKSLETLEALMRDIHHMAKCSKELVGKYYNKKEMIPCIADTLCAVDKKDSAEFFKSVCGACTSDILLQWTEDQLKDILEYSSPNSIDFLRETWEQFRELYSATIAYRNALFLQDNPSLRNL